MDDIIARKDEENNISLNKAEGGGSLSDMILNLEKFENYIKNFHFSKFNYVADILNKNSETSMKTNYTTDFVIDEIYLIKLTTEKMLGKYATILKDLVDCKDIISKIAMEGLNGFLVIENEELVLYSIYRYTVRDNNHNINQGKNKIKKNLFIVYYYYILCRNQA